MSFGEGNLRTAVAELTAENDELRQLVRDLLPCYRWSDCCGRPCQNEGEVHASCPQRVEERVRELGVEQGGRQRPEPRKAAPDWDTEVLNA